VDSGAVSILVGIDGGGTRTRIAVQNGGSLGEPLLVGASSLSRRGVVEVESELRDAVSRAVAAPESVAAVCAGFASAGTRRADYDAILRRIFPAARIRVLTDAELAWRGAFGGEDGIVVISGTGSIAWGRYQRHQARAGGLGPGRDRGSGDWLAAHPGSAAQREAGRDLAALVHDVAAQLAWPQPRVCAVGGVVENVAEVRRALAQSLPWPLAAPRASATAAALSVARSLLDPGPPPSASA